MADDNSSPVPLGRANTGSAVVFGDGLGALRYLQRADLMAQKLKQREAQQKAKQQDADFKSFTTNSKLDTEAGVHYGPMLRAKANETYDKMQALIGDRTLTREQRFYKQQQLKDEFNREAKASITVDKHLDGLVKGAGSDKRVNTEQAARLVHNTLYKDGEQISPLDYDPQTAEAALASGNEHLVAPEIYNQFLDKQPENSISYSREALPGGRGFRNVAKSNIYELTPEGQIRRDPTTNKPVLRDTPETLLAFDQDPLQKQYLDGFEKVHQQQLAGAVQKMAANEQLTPEESEAVRVEQSPAGRRMELFKRGLMQYGYGREETSLLQKPARAPRASAAAKAPTNVVNLPTDSLPGAVLGGTGVNGTSGIVSYGMMPALTYGKPGQEAKKYPARGVKHQEVVTQRDDGSPAEVTTANQAKMDVEYGARHILLRGENGTVFFPPKAALEAAKRGDFGPSEEFARQTRATHPGTKPEWYVEATPLNKSATQPGTKLKYYEQLKAAQDADGSVTQKLTDQQLHEKANREFGKQNATHYVRYRGQDKILVDQAYGYALRNTKAGKAAAQAMDDALADADKRTRPQAGAPRAATSAGSFYTPKLPKATKAATTGATPKNLPKPATRDPYAL